jgi:hypothetical protein
MTGLAQIADVSTWVLGEPREVSEGIRSYPISVDGKWLTIQLLRTLAPFELSSLTEGTSRKTLTLRLPKDYDEAFGDMECALVKMISKRSKELFGKRLSEEQLLESYKPLSKKTGEYPRNVKTKVNQGGQYATRYWGVDKVPAQPVESHAGRMFNVSLNIRSLWMGPDAWGLVCDCRDLQLTDEPVEECPFI